MTMQIDNTSFVGFAEKPKRTVPAVNGGANRGAREGLGAYEEFNASSTAAEIVPTYVDAMPGRAAELVADARRRGLRAQAIEGRIEDALAHGDFPGSAPIVLNLDRASAIANVLESPGIERRAILGYLLLKLPSSRLWGLRFVLEPGDAVVREGTARFFRQLAALSERGGSGAIFGAGGDPADALNEPLFRRWFKEHARANFAKIVSGLEPMSNALEITPDGSETMPLFLAARSFWGDARELGLAVVADPTSPIRRGTRFGVAEMTPEGIRFHVFAWRTDAELAELDADTLDHAGIDAALARAEAARREDAARAEAARRAEERGGAFLVGAAVGLALGVGAALALADRESVTRRNPVRTTD